MQGITYRNHTHTHKTVLSYLFNWKSSRREGSKSKSSEVFVSSTFYYVFCNCTLNDDIYENSNDCQLPNRFYANREWANVFPMEIFSNAFWIVSIFLRSMELRTFMLLDFVFLIWSNFWWFVWISGQLVLVNACGLTELDWNGLDSSSKYSDLWRNNWYAKIILWLYFARHDFQYNYRF